jgi:bacillithiol biosynthesis cysteine-adding enzyme BshC
MAIRFREWRSANIRRRRPQQRVHALVAFGSATAAYNQQMAAARVIDYGTFAQPPSALFRDYMSGAPKVAPFFPDGGRWDLAAIDAAATRAAAREFQRRELVGALVAQQRARGAAKAAETAGRLSDPKAVTIISGQQPVLFGGPLYVLYKALAAVELARRLEAQRGTPVVPVFWIAADDHDFAEIRTLAVLADSGTLRTVRYAPRHEPHGAPANAIVLDDTIAGLLDELANVLPSGEGRDVTIAQLAAAYVPGRTIVDAFARWLTALIPDLVVLDPADEPIKRLMVPVFERELRDGSPSSCAVAKAGEGLLTAGYHQQVPIRQGLLNLFLVVDGARRALGLANGLVEVRGDSERFTVEEAVHRLHAEPARWSAGALLRPLAQDWVFPTAAYVGGPAEVAYHAQIGTAYASFGLPRPTVMPRPGVTLLDAQSTRALEAEGLDLSDFQGDAEGLLGRWAHQAYPELESNFDRMRSAVTREMGELARALGAHDPTLEGAASAATGRMLHPLESLQEKSMRALKKRDQVRTDRLRRTHDMLFPGGSFQERGLSVIGMLARYGDGLLGVLRESIDPFARGHQVVKL